MSLSKEDVEKMLRPKVAVTETTLEKKQVPSMNSPARDLTNAEIVVRQNVLRHADEVFGKMPESYRGYPAGEQWVEQYLSFAEELEKWVWRKVQQ
jgi:hypothetical protein